MNKRIGKSPSVELQRLGGPPSSTAIVCVPYAGGGAAAFRSWPNLLGSVDVYALSFPGRDARLFDPLFTTMDLLVASIVDAIRPLADRRFALFGHSMGGLLAYEAVRVLRRQNATPPVHIFVSGIRAPHLPDPNPKIFDLPDNLFVEELCRFEATTLNVDQHSEIIALMLPTLRADFRIVQTYRYYPEKPLVCPITAFGGLQDKTTSEREMQQWRHHTGRAFNLVMLSGGHFFLDTAVNSVLKHIKAQLGSN